MYLQVLSLSLERAMCYTAKRSLIKPNVNDLHERFETVLCLERLLTISMVATTESKIAPAIELTKILTSAALLKPVEAAFGNSAKCDK
jgi:hypothetical protein